MKYAYNSYIVNIQKKNAVLDSLENDLNFCVRVTLLMGARREVPQVCGDFTKRQASRLAPEMLVLEMFPAKVACFQHCA